MSLLLVYCSHIHCSLSIITLPSIVDIGSRDSVWAGHLLTDHRKTSLAKPVLGKARCSIAVLFWSISPCFLVYCGMLTIWISLASLITQMARRWKQQEGAG